MYRKDKIMTQWNKILFSKLQFRVLQGDVEILAFFLSQLNILFNNVYKEKPARNTYLIIKRQLITLTKKLYSIFNYNNIQEYLRIY